MGAPAPHVPIIFLMGGGSGFFSERCQNALIAAALNPDWFGSYDHVGRRTRAARIRVNDWNAMTPDQQAANPGAQPTAEDRFLANCTASHMIQDGVYRGTKGDPLLPGSQGRGDPCASLVDGYTERQAPAVPGQGTSKMPGSVESELSKHEDATRRAQIDRMNKTTGVGGAAWTPPLTGKGDPQAGVEPPDRRYPSTQRGRDEDARGGVLANNQQNGWNDVMKAQQAKGTSASDAPVLQGSGRGGKAANAGESAQFAKAIGAKTPAGDPTGVPGGPVDGRNARECINAWRRRAAAAMKSSGLKQEIDDRKAATTPPEPANRKNDLAAAETNEAAAKAHHNAVKNDSAATAEDKDRAEAAYNAAKFRTGEKRDAHALSETTPAQFTCLENMQNRLQSGTGVRTVGRTFS